MLTMQKIINDIINKDQVVQQSSTRRRDTYITVYSKRQTALHIAAQNGNADEVARLLSIIDEIPYYLTDEDGNTALHLAAANGYRECVDIILRRMLKDLKLRVKRLEDTINAKNNKQETALHLAVKNNHCECIELLIKDTDASIQNLKRQTALCIAVLLENAEVVNIFVKNKHVDCDVKDENGDSVYDHVRRGDNQDLVKSLLRYYKDKEKEVQQGVERSECITTNSKKFSKYCNRLIAVTGTVAAITTTYVEFAEDSVDDHVKRSLGKLTHATEKIADGMKKHIDNYNKGKKEISKGKKLAKKAAISANKVKEIMTFNKSLFAIKTSATLFSITTCALVVPVCAFYCVSRYYNKRQKLLSDTVEVCQERQSILKDRYSELKKQEKNSKNLSQIQSTVIGLKEEFKDSSNLSAGPNTPDERFLQVGSFRPRTRSCGERDAKKSAQSRRFSYAVQGLRVEQPTCSKYLNTTQV